MSIRVNSVDSVLNNYWESEPETWLSKRTNKTTRLAVSPGAATALYQTSQLIGGDRYIKCLVFLIKYRGTRYPDSLVFSFYIKGRL